MKKILYFVIIALLIVFSLGCFSNILNCVHMGSKVEDSIEETFENVETNIEDTEDTESFVDTVTFTISYRYGAEDYYTVNETVEKGTTWEQWCTNDNANAGMDIWAASPGGFVYVHNNIYNFYLVNESGSPELWASEIVSGDYGGIDNIS